MEIIKANRIHINELEELYNDLNDYLAVTVNHPGWIKHVYPVRETAEQGIEDESLFIAVADGSIAGSIILNHEPETAYNEVKWFTDTTYDNILVIRTLVVHPQYLHKGVGIRLLEFSRNYAAGLGIKSIRLDVSVNNKPAIRLYKKAGYRYVATVDLGLPYEHLKWFELYELVL